MVRFTGPSAIALVALGVLLGTPVSSSDETSDLRPAADRLVAAAGGGRHDSRRVLGAAP